MRKQSEPAFMYLPACLMSQTGGRSTFFPLIALTSSGSSAVPAVDSSASTSETAPRQRMPDLIHRPQGEKSNHRRRRAAITSDGTAADRGQPARGPGAGGPPAAVEEGGGRQREWRARGRHWGGDPSCCRVSRGCARERGRRGRVATTWLRWSRKPGWQARPLLPDEAMAESTRL
jgi:hypothetical protein